MVVLMVTAIVRVSQQYRIAISDNLDFSLVLYMLKIPENLTSPGQNASNTSDVQNDVFFATGTTKISSTAAAIQF
jgi:hypothetical protein